LGNPNTFASEDDGACLIRRAYRSASAIQRAHSNIQQEGLKNPKSLCLQFFLLLENGKN
jgi:hypothetical protein